MLRQCLLHSPFTTILIQRNINEETKTRSPRRRPFIFATFLKQAFAMKKQEDLLNKDSTAKDEIDFISIFQCLSSLLFSFQIIISSIESAKSSGMREQETHENGRRKKGVSFNWTIAIDHTHNAYWFGYCLSFI